jgi:hypothetical protein
VERDGRQAYADAMQINLEQSKYSYDNQDRMEVIELVVRK